MVLIGMALPVLHQQNLYPLIGTLLALLAGLLFAWWAPGSTLLPALSAGGLAGGMSSLAGALLAALLGQASPGVVTTVLIATLTGMVAGAVGGFFGRLFAPARR